MATTETLSNSSGLTNRPTDDWLSHYRRILATGKFESSRIESNNTNGTKELDLTNQAIEDRLEKTTANWAVIIKNHLGDDPRLYEIAQQISRNGQEALRVVRENDVKRINEKPEILDHLEAIIRTDGSRPSFMIRQGQVDKSTSPTGDWSDTLDASAGLLQNSIACVGRIDDPAATAGFVGTGFLIAPNLILTNRHVLQGVAHQDANQKWRFHPGAQIDFGHEFRAKTTKNPRAFNRVVFAGADNIASIPPVDHKKLDLALIELMPAPVEQLPLSFLAIDVAPDWAEPELGIFTIGYPANPGNSIHNLSLLEQLFRMTFGCKRLAPGRIMKSQVTTEVTTASHDATTLGGNSGSAVLIVGREHVAAGLHFGGRSGEPRENWAHILGAILDRTDGKQPKTLREHLTEAGVVLIDRI